MVAVAGKNQIAVDAVILLLNKNVPKDEIVAVTNKSDIGLDGWQPSFKNFCKLNRIRIVDLEELYKVKDLVFLSTEFDRIIKPEFFSSTQLYNIHFSLLPAYKGMYTSVMPLLNGELESGVTLHRMDKGIDTGEIIDQLSFDITHETTALDMYHGYLSTGKDILYSNIDLLLSNNAYSTPQSPSGSTYYSKAEIDFNNIIIDLNKTAWEVQKQIHAFSFRPYQLPEINSHRVTHAEILRTRSNSKPGTIILDSTYYYEIATIDYDLRVYKDRLSNLLSHCSNGNLYEVLLALKSGVRIEDKNEKGWNMLIVAAYNGYLEICRELLKKGANVNSFNNNGTSVLMYALTTASKNKNYALVTEILRWKPNIEHKDLSGKSVRDWAVFYGDEKIIRRLNEIK